MKYFTSEFDKRYSKKRCFIIGGGPSILHIRKEGFCFHDLKEELTIGVNKAYKLLDSDYHCIADFYFWENFKEEIKKVKSVKFCPDYLARRSGGVEHDMFLIKSNMKDDIGSLSVDTFSKEVSAWNNTGVWALRVAYIMGLNPIYLIGMDVLRADRDGNTHFHKDYGNDRINQISNKRYDNFFLAWQRTITFLKKRNIDIFSCSKISRLNNMINYVDIQKVLK